MSSSSRGHGIASQDPSWQSLKNKDTIVHRPWKFWPPARLPEGPPGCQRSTASGEGLESADAGCAAAGPSPKRRPQSSRGRISGNGTGYPEQSGVRAPEEQKPWAWDTRAQVPSTWNGPEQWGECRGRTRSSPCAPPLWARDHDVRWGPWPRGGGGGRCTDPCTGGGTGFPGLSTGAAWQFLTVLSAGAGLRLGCGSRRPEERPTPAAPQLQSGLRRWGPRVSGCTSREDPCASRGETRDGRVLETPLRGERRFSGVSAASGLLQLVPLRLISSKINVCFIKTLCMY